jgi:rhamnose utilization protein RhaD (predicted bifunctional aldolase and dehydrogenase)/NAD(P)-dependent dehydrogenase (short-subunit alcohol dehydrogenase family)
MRSRWSDAEESAFLDLLGGDSGPGGDVASRTYSARLIGQEPELVLHGGGNTSVKTSARSVLGESMPVIHVKASGCDLASITPKDQPAINLAYLRRLLELDGMSDAAMVNELMTHLLRHDAPMPSMEALVHAAIPARFVDHTHADAILALTNQSGGDALVREALGESVMVLEYVPPGFGLAKAVAASLKARPRALVLMQHGLITWGQDARESYETTIELVTRAEEFASSRRRRGARRTAPRGNGDHATPTSIEDAVRRYERIAPVLRGALAERTGSPDRPYRRVILSSLIDRATLDFVDGPRGRELALTPPVTTDHLIRTKPLPLWLEPGDFEDESKLAMRIHEAAGRYAREYSAYVDRHVARLADQVLSLDPLPRVVLIPGVGAVCAGGDVVSAGIARDITRHTLAIKSQIAEMGGSYLGLPEDHLFDMEYRALQRAKLPAARPPLAGTIAVVTGAAGAIGSGITRGLLENGCHVAAADLPGAPLEDLVRGLGETFQGRVTDVAMDVTDPDSVERGLDEIAAAWGGLDILVLNAGVAHVSTIADMDLEAFRRCQRVNEEGTLLVLRAAARRFARQRTGGDCVLVSTKNVFAPGAGFGAYSATKAASHQLARIASCELAPLDVRVNMVSPDAVFSDGARRSGLWAQVGPSRMRARGLDEAGLEEYYRERNLLKARVTAEHVARAVLFFVTRQTPTTGATIPVDGGLPDSTPR